jgi:hypothetical protein
MARPTQIYLQAEQHAALAAAARRSGRSMTQVVRDLIDTHLVPDAAPPTDLSGLIGSIDLGVPTNVAQDKDRMLAEALTDVRRR